MVSLSNQLQGWVSPCNALVSCLAVPQPEGHGGGFGEGLPVLISAVCKRFLPELRASPCA